MPALNTLVKDIHDVIEGSGGWDAAITEFMSDEVRDLVRHRLESGEEHKYVPRLRLSNMGTPCTRKLWYDINTPNEGEVLPPQARIKFLYGDLIEVLILSLAKAAGHDVQGCQDVLSVHGIEGHRDAVIDGITVDVKSASPQSFSKFKYGKLRDDDPFGYISQLAAYVYAGRTSDIESHPTVGAFLAVDKVSGEIVVDTYDFSVEIEGMEAKFADTTAKVNADTPPERGFEPKADGYTKPKSKGGGFVPNGNLKLGLNCSYCNHKHACWPALRTFMYKSFDSTRPVFMTHVAKAPNVPEVT